MAREASRLPIVYRYFKDNSTKFAEFIGRDTSDPEFFRARNLFLQNYEYLLAFHIKNSDVRLGQMFYNVGMTDDAAYNKEEKSWLIRNNYLTEEDFKLKEEFKL